MGDWARTHLGDVVDVIMGQSPASETYNNLRDGFPLIQGAADLGAYTPKPQRFTSSPTKVSAPGDTLISVRAPVGLANWVDGQYCLGRGVAALRARAGMNDVFLYYLTHSMNTYWQQQATGTTFPGVSGDTIRKTPIVIPPLHEQREIASILGALDDKIELNRRMNATLEAMIRALFQSWFVDFDPVRAKAEGRQPVGMDTETAALFPDSFEDSALGLIPKGWAVMALGEVCDLEYGKPLKAEDRRGGDIPVFGAGGQVGWHNEALATGPGIVVGRKGNPGAVTWSQSDFFAIDTAFFAKSKHPALSPYILFQILSNLDLSRLSVDSGVPGLNRHHAYMSLLVVAATPILQAFNTHAQTLGAEFASNDNSSRSLVGLRNLLIPKLLSGELRVGDVAA